ncbi:BatD [hydrothermal vent metagenome]|uniref:BatD n=1 Tax=hydrothermal vent metagenome TaxID=652676 RepID=A0A1W1CK67_9ZZZZ
MRNSLGKIVIFLLTISIVYAEDFTYNLKVDNKTPYLKEGVILTVELNQTNPDIVLFFDFEIKKSDRYSFTRLDTIETDTHHNAKVKYLYLLYPLKDKEVEIEFNLIKKITTDENVAYSFSGDRDNVKGIVTKDTPITLPPLQLNVKALPKETLLVGDFTLNYSIKKHKAKAYEPLPFQVTIEGKGYPPLLDSILPKDGNFTRFEDKAIVKSKGTKNNITYPMALSHAQSFTLPPIVLKAFNPKTEKSYELKIPKQKFEIKEVATQDLIDKSDSPALLEQDWSWLRTLLSYIVVFIAGYFTAFSIKWRKKDTIKKSNPLRVKIESCKDEKALLQLLMATDSKRFISTIEILERALYQGAKIDFKKIKREIKI